MKITAADVTYDCGAQLHDEKLGNRFPECLSGKSDDIIVMKLFQPVCTHCCSEECLINTANCCPHCPLLGRNLSMMMWK